MGLKKSYSRPCQWLTSGLIPITSFTVSSMSVSRTTTNLPERSSRASASWRRVSPPASAQGVSPAKRPVTSTMSWLRSSSGPAGRTTAWTTSPKPRTTWRTTTTRQSSTPSPWWSWAPCTWIPVSSRSVWVTRNCPCRNSSNCKASLINCWQARGTTISTA